MVKTVSYADIYAYRPRDPGHRAGSAAGDPGFNDAHVHFASGRRVAARGRPAGTTWLLAEIERRVAKAASRAQPGEWIVEDGADHTRLPRRTRPGGWPTRRSLDRAAPRDPVLLSRVDGTLRWANAEALHIAGRSTRSTPNPAGGEWCGPRHRRGDRDSWKESADGIVAE